MNEEMKISPRGVRLVASFEGKPRLMAKRCPGGLYELSYGCTTWPDGRAIAATDSCTEDQALQLFAYHLTRFEEVVEREVKCVLLQHQYDALVAFAYNIGPTQFADSTAVELLNKVDGPRWADAAAAMGWYKYSTLEPHEQGPDDPDYWFRTPADELGHTKPCNYRRQLRGLLRRHYAEACMLLGFDWQVACHDDAIRLRTKFMFNAEKGFNEDITEAQTPWEEVVEVARRYPLQPEAPAVAAPAPVAAAVPAPAPVKPVAAAPAAAPPAAAKPQAPAPAKGTVDIANADIGKIRVDNGAKVMETSDRAVAVGLKLGGIGVKKFCEHRLLPAVVGSVYFDVVSDPVIVATITIGVVALWTWGHATLVAGRRKRAKHAATATTLTY